MACTRCIPTSPDFAVIFTEWIDSLKMRISRGVVPSRESFTVLHRLVRLVRFGYTSTKFLLIIYCRGNSATCTCCDTDQDFFQRFCNFCSTLFQMHRSKLKRCRITCVFLLGFPSRTLASSDFRIIKLSALTASRICQCYHGIRHGCITARHDES